MSEAVASSGEGEGGAAAPGRDVVVRTEPPRKRAAAKRTPARRGKRKPAKRVAWSAKRERVFLETLAETSNVAASARAAGVSDTTVYRRRQLSAEFRAKWAVALREGYLKLEATMLERALNGVEKDVWYGGQKVGIAREINDRLGLALLAQHHGSVNGETPPPLPIDDLRAALKTELGEMNLRMGGAG